MKLAEAMWEPRPGRFGYMFALPMTVPSSSTATTVRPGGPTIHIAPASDSSISGS